MCHSWRVGHPLPWLDGSLPWQSATQLNGTGGAFSGACDSPRMVLGIGMPEFPGSREVLVQGPCLQNPACCPCGFVSSSCLVLIIPTCILPCRESLARQCTSRWLTHFLLVQYARGGLADGIVPTHRSAYQRSWQGGRRRPSARLRMLSLLFRVGGASTLLRRRRKECDRRYQ